MIRVESSPRVCVVSILLFFSLGCGKQPAGNSLPSRQEEQDDEIVVMARPEVPDQDFAGSQSCRECHEEIVALYSSHPMGRSAGSLKTGPVIEDYQSAHFLTDNRLEYSAIRKKNGTVIHREKKLYRTEQSDGEKDGRAKNKAVPKTSTIASETGPEKFVYQIDHEVKYYLGSGQRGRSYLLEKEGLLFQSPVTWYSTSARWGLSPGYIKKNPHFERRIIDGCVTCHVGRVARDSQGRENRFSCVPHRLEQEQANASADSQIMIESAISCERCHGPAADHVAFQRGEGKQHSSEKDPILLIAKMNSVQRESLCNQCHLLGLERILRYGRTEYDFRPGDDVSDIWITFVNGTGVQGSSTDVVSHVEQMHSSRCYQKSAGAMDCTSCHDPHTIPEEQQRAAFYRNKCVACHNNQQTVCSVPPATRKLQSPEDSCISCHMPALLASNVPHTSQTDHRIKRIPKKQESADSKPNKKSLMIFNNADQHLPEPSVHRARALLMAIYAQRDNDLYLARAASENLKPLLKNFPDDTRMLLDIGILERLYGSKPEAKAYLEKALQINPQHEEPLKQLGLLYHQMQEYDKGLDYLQRYLQLNPWDRDATGREIHMLGLTNQFSLGISKANQALKKFPGDWRIHGWLADAYRKIDRPREAQIQTEIYNQVKPAQLR